MPKLKNAGSHSLGALVDEHNLLYKAGMQDNINFLVTPATSTPAPTAAAWTTDVTIKIVDDAGVIFTDFTKILASGACSIANTSVAGTATLEDTTMEFVNGICTKTVTGSEHDWLADETWTFTAIAATILSGSVAAKTSVATFTAV